VGIESTVLDLTGDIPRVLRPGAVTVEQLRDALGEVETPKIVSQAASPGTSAAHYAPRTPAELVDARQIASRLCNARTAMAVMCFDAAGIQPPHRAIIMPRDAAQYAARLYEALRQADSTACAAILIERPPTQGELWTAIHDRLRRATTNR
jgi:L-threonylcarbamoyladenylate synthase